LYSKMAGRLYNLAGPGAIRLPRRRCRGQKRSREVSLAYQKFSDPRAASRFLAQREEVRLLGGGTLLVRRVNEGDVSIGTYVRLLAPELQQIEVGDDVVRLGAGVTMSRIAQILTLAFLAPVARSIGGPAVRAAATVGGNLFAPSPFGDFGVALLALDAVAAIEGPEGARKLELESFLKARAPRPRHDRHRGALSSPQSGDFRFVKGQPRQAERNGRGLYRCPAFQGERPRLGGACCARRHGGNANPGARRSF
jgi:FAD binding domain in molybdopterin dehydrogenase